MQGLDGRAKASTSPLWLRLWFACLLGACMGDAWASVDVAALDAQFNARSIDALRAGVGDWQAQPPALRWRSGSQWWRVAINAEAAKGDDDAWVLSLREAYDARLVAYLPPDYTPRPLHLYDPDLQQPGSRHRIALVLSPAQRAQPVYLRVEWARHQPITVDAQPLSRYLQDDLDRVRVSSALLATKLLLAIVCSLFALALRRHVLALLCVWILSAAVYQAVMSGEVVRLLGAWTLALPPMVVSGVIVHIGLLASYAFVYRFLSVPLQFPRLARLFRALLWCAALLTLMTVISLAGPQAARLMNVILLLLATLALGMALRLALRGVEQGWFYLVGWGAVAVVAIIRAGYFLAEQGTPLWLEYAHPAMDAFGALVLVLAIARAARYAEREMHAARVSARIDPLTGLPNRGELDARLPERIQAAQQAGRALSLLFFDLDHFKRINDRWGHDLGDVCLVAAAAEIRKHIRASDLVARYGGEEFVLILDGADLEVATAIAGELRAGVERHGHSVAGQPVGLTVSIGIAQLRPGDAASELLRRADEALYRAKAEGRNRVVLAGA